MIASSRPKTSGVNKQDIPRRLNPCKDHWGSVFSVS
jgi:hypothetical protein